MAARRIGVPGRSLRCRQPRRSGTTPPSPSIPTARCPSPYFKQILIPFGEYMPFSSVFPWLNSLNENAGLFSPGQEIKVFSYPMRRPDGPAYTAKVGAPDLLRRHRHRPGSRRDAARGRAARQPHIRHLVRPFGGPYQHHLIAIFRAIENRRYLIRSTYTGYTAVVNPLGKTIADIPAFEEGKLTVDVTLMNYQSSYTNYVGELPWWGLLAVSAWEHRGPTTKFGPAAGVRTGMVQIARFAGHMLVSPFAPRKDVLSRSERRHWTSAR